MMNVETNEELTQIVNDYVFLDSKRYNRNLGSDE